MNAVEVGPITGTDGAGCGLYGYRGTYDRAYIRLKNNAAARGANYVQIYSIQEPHLSAGCFVNEFAIAGMAYRIDPPPGRRVRATTVMGTCFAVSPDGLLLTAFHTVDGSDSIAVRFPGGKELDAKLEQASANNDLALLRIPRKTPAYLTFSDPRTAKAGDEVFTIGFPAARVLGTEPKFTEGDISALSGPGGESTFLQISVPVQPGNSGGPLVNHRGEVVGVVTSTAAIVPFLRATGSLPQNVNFAVKGGYAELLFSPPAPLPTATDRDSAIKRTREAICEVRAHRAS